MYQLPTMVLQRKRRILLATTLILAGVVLAMMVAPAAAQEDSGGVSELNDTNPDELSNTVTLEEEPGISTRDLPENVQVWNQLLEQIEVEQAGPEDLPVGKNATIDVCEPTQVDGSEIKKLPIDLVPQPSDIPSEAVPERVPTAILRYEDVTSLPFAYYDDEGLCGYLDPQDPPVDPTDPPEDAHVELEFTRLGEFQDGFVSLSKFEVTAVNDDGDQVGVASTNGLLITKNFGDSDQKLTVDDGENEYGVDHRFKYDNDSYTINNGVIYRGTIGADTECDTVEQWDTNAIVENLLDPRKISGNSVFEPCDVKPIGVVRAVDAEQVVGIIVTNIENPPEPIEVLEALLTWDELPIGDLPINEIEQDLASDN